MLLTGHRGSVKSVAYSPDGKRIASGGEDRVVRVRDSVDGRELLALKGHSGQIESVKFSLDGKCRKSVSNGGSVGSKANGATPRSRDAFAVNEAREPSGSPQAPPSVTSTRVSP